MDGIIYLVIGLIVGGAAGFAIAMLRGKSGGVDDGAAKKIAELQQLAAGLESTEKALREQSSEKDRTIQEIRTERDSEMKLRSAAEAKLAEAFKNIEEQKKLLNEAGVRMTETFKALSHDALKSNNSSFLELAQKTMEKLSEEMKGDLGKRQEAISGIVKPLGDALKTYQQGINELEVHRKDAYSTIVQQIKNLGETNIRLQKETGNLVSALRKPHVRGKWGEFTLRRTAELAGMVEYCDFIEQESSRSSEGDLQRPDMVVKLPGGGSIVVDSKAPLAAYLDMVEAEDEAGRQEALRRHANHLKTHMRSLSSKEYWRNMENTPEFVVMFLPGESFLIAALEMDRELLEEGFLKKVIIATPTTLIALLKTAAAAWRQEQVTENAKRIIELGGTLYDRISTFITHFEKVGKGLKAAGENYNKAVGSLERNVLTSARRFRELGAATGDELQEVPLVDTALRELSAPEVPQNTDILDDTSL